MQQGYGEAMDESAEARAIEFPQTHGLRSLIGGTGIPSQEARAHAEKMVFEMEMRLKEMQDELAKKELLRAGELEQAKAAGRDEIKQQEDAARDEIDIKVFADWHATQLERELTEEEFANIAENVKRMLPSIRTAELARMQREKAAAIQDTPMEDANGGGQQPPPVAAGFQQTPSLYESEVRRTTEERMRRYMASKVAGGMYPTQPSQQQQQQPSNTQSMSLDTPAASSSSNMRGGQPWQKSSTVAGSSNQQQRRPLNFEGTRYRDPTNGDVKYKYDDEVVASFMKLKTTDGYVFGKPLTKPSVAARAAIYNDENVKASRPGADQGLRMDGSKRFPRDRPPGEDDEFQAWPPGDGLNLPHEWMKIQEARVWIAAPGGDSTLNNTMRMDDCISADTIRRNGFNSQFEAAGGGGGNWRPQISTGTSGAAAMREYMAQAGGADAVSAAYGFAPASLTMVDRAQSNCLPV